MADKEFTKELADEELGKVAGGGNPSKEEKKWAEEAAGEGRSVKYCRSYAKDACKECNAVGAVYAKSLHQSYDDAKAMPMKVYSDCKCYNCGREWEVLRDYESIINVLD